jgi:hypothetical protein
MVTRWSRTPVAEGIVILQHPDSLNAARNRRKLRDLYLLWKARASFDRIPRRASFIPEDFKPWMGNIAIVGVEGTPPRFLLRLIGNRIVDYDGANFTGRYLDEVLQGPVRDAVLAQYADCARSGLPMAFRYRLESYGTRGGDRGLTAIDKLFLPMSHDGSNVSQLFVGLYATFFVTDSLDPPLLKSQEGGDDTVAFSPDEL